MSRRSGTENREGEIWVKKNRMVAWSAVAGFVLSFGIGLFSSVPFGVVLLRAVIAAGAFGMLGIAIRFVFARFIADASEGGDAVETDGGAPVRTVGAAVDITLPDEELPREEHASQFYVGSQHPMLNEGEYGAAARASS
ncbi:MAG: hypothetical protein IJ191_06100, partial [Treponema sp.]|nr:hypothetical protein [Treponema sp.]